MRAARCGAQAGLEPLCRALFLSAARLADSLNLLYKKYEPDDGAVLPEELAAAHVAEARPRPRCPNPEPVVASSSADSPHSLGSSAARKARSGACVSALLLGVHLLHCSALPFPTFVPETKPLQARLEIKLWPALFPCCCVDMQRRLLLEWRHCEYTAMQLLKA